MKTITRSEAKQMLRDPDLLWEIDGAKGFSPEPLDVRETCFSFTNPSEPVKMGLFRIPPQVLLGEDGAILITKGSTVSRLKPYKT